jgi:serine/threonine-protein kinase
MISLNCVFFDCNCFLSNKNKFLKLLTIFAFKIKASLRMLKSLFNWRVLLNLVLAIIVFVGLIWLTFRWLEYHTHHGQEIPVPNVVNKSVHDAIKILDDSGLDYEVDSSKFDPKYRPFQVLGVNPMPGSRVKDGRSILLKVNPRTWAPVSVPDVLNKYAGLAYQRLEQVGLKVGDTIYEPSIQKDAVIRLMLNGAEIKPGKTVPRFTTLDLVIGTGPMRNIAIPNVVGLTVKEAKIVIARQLFEVGLIEHDGGGQDENDIIYFQDPAYGDLRDQGMQIDLWASKKTPAEMQGKINQLNSIYRVKVDTTLAPVRYEEVQRSAPSIDQEVVPAPPVRETPKVEQPKPEAPKTTQSAKPATTSATQPKPDAKPKTTTTATSSAPKPSAAPAEKPKKKVVVE